ncbi:hypothetical protein [Rhodococcus opacus]|uniref:hypothetical protein n=1 Tax=Rhodococcus opacus TaxID=37919 RepID=UPI00295497C9|nr:hypothetical protein [Rhodococcus opacus]MDV7088033.1 hypothetical protein [Rhodococcus opacus]
MIRTTMTALAAVALVFGAASVTQTAAAAHPACNSSYEGTTNDEYDPDPDFTGTTNDEYDPDPEYSGTSNREYDPDPEFHGSTDPCQV